VLGQEPQRLEILPAELDSARGCLGGAAIHALKSLERFQFLPLGVLD
jgi:hypothetical protein